MKFLDDFFTYKQALIEKRNELSNDISKLQARAKKRKTAGESEQSVASDVRAEYRDLLAELNNVDDEINQEIGYAQKAMELSLAAYNELHIAWAIHVKNLELIDQLEDFRNALSKIRREVELFPATFFNVQTAKCT